MKPPALDTQQPTASPSKKRTSEMPRSSKRTKKGTASTPQIDAATSRASAQDECSQPTAHDASRSPSDQVTIPATNESDDPVADTVAESVANRVVLNIADRFFDRLSGNISDRIIEHVFDHVAQRVVDRVAERVADRLVDPIANRLIERVVDHVANDSQAMNEATVDADREGKPPPRSEKAMALAYSNASLRAGDPLPDMGWNVKKCFNDLDATIGLLCDTAFSKKSWEALSNPTRDKFLSWAPNAQTIFQFDGGCGSKYFFHSWIWRILHENVLLKKDDSWIAWTKDAYAAVHNIQKDMMKRNPEMPTEKVIEKWHHWKWSSLALYAASLKRDPFALANGPIEDRYRIFPKSVKAMLKKSLGQSLPKRLPKDRQQAQDSWLDSVVADALELELVWSVTQADYRLLFHHPVTEEVCGFPLEKEIPFPIMDEVEELQRKKGRDGLPVELVVAPLLQFRGDKGIDYGKWKQSGKMIVVANVNRYLANEQEKDEEGEKSVNAEDGGKDGSKGKAEGDAASSSK